MLGFWIIVAHLVGAYLITPEYVLMKTPSSTLFSVVHAVLYMIPFVLFLPGTPASFAAVLIFRFITVRFSLMAYVIWAKNQLAPKHARTERILSGEEVKEENISPSTLIGIHAGSVAVHSIAIAIAVMLL